MVETKLVSEINLEGSIKQTFMQETRFRKNQCRFCRLIAINRIIIDSLPLKNSISLKPLYSMTPVEKYC